MPASGSSQTLLSPAELSYLHSSLSLSPPIRPDLRSPTQFRPLVAETDIIPSTNGSARICFSDGTEAIVGVKAEIEKAARTAALGNQSREKDEDIEMEDGDSESEGGKPGQPAGTKARKQVRGSSAWLEVTVEIPGFRDDDTLPIFLASMLTEVLLASGSLKEKLYINDRWHWMLYIDILSLSPPLSYPLPLLSLTTHLALLRTALPRLISDPNDDPLFDDDWAAAVLLYDQSDLVVERPPITLVVMTIGDNFIFDPSRDELAAAEGVVAISFAPSSKDVSGEASASLKLLAIRMIDPPSRLTAPGVANASVSSLTGNEGLSLPWTPPKGGIKRALLSNIIKLILEPGGVGSEIIEALACVET